MRKPLAERGGGRPGDDADHQLFGSEAAAQLGHDPAEHLRFDAEQDDIGVEESLGVQGRDGDVMRGNQGLRRAARGWVQTMFRAGTRSCSSRPASIASAITPVPTIPIRIPRRLSALM